MEWFIKLDKFFANQYGTHTKILQSNRGGEYVNAPLEGYCAENRIKLKFTIPHTPKQNSVAERTNRKILNKGRMVMKDAGAPDFLWADAFATVVYAMNQTTSAQVGDKMPYEAFFGRKPDISQMRVWYLDVFVHQPKELGARKLGECSSPAKFLSYPETSTGYGTYNPVNHKVTVVHAPAFHEEAHSCPNTTFETPANDSDDDITDNTTSPPPNNTSPLPDTPHDPPSSSQDHPVCT